jgi:hypothetical protein
MLFYRLVKEEWGASVADRAVWYLLIFPTALFGSAIYSESLFLLLAVGALYLARKGYWESAAMLGFLAALTRLVGILVAPMLLVEWWMQRRHREPDARPPLWALAVPAAVALGTVAYMFYLWRLFGNPFAFAQASSAWGREPTLPLVTMADLLQQPVEGWRAALLAGAYPWTTGSTCWPCWRSSGWASSCSPRDVGARVYSSSSARWCPSARGF